MRRVCWLVPLVWWGCATLTGCGLMSQLFIPSVNPDGSLNAPPLDHVIGFLQSWPGIGTAIAAGLGAVRWGTVEVAHRKLIAAGKKDDNNNGVDDGLEKPPTAPPAAPAV